MVGEGLGEGLTEPDLSTGLWDSQPLASSGVFWDSQLRDLWVTVALDSRAGEYLCGWNGVSEYESGR